MGDAGSTKPIAHSRGLICGLLLMLLGLWGALLPFIGPYLGIAFNPDVPWVWTPARGWLEVLPGAATVLGGLLLVTRNETAEVFGGWLAVAAGVWFVIGRPWAAPWSLGDVGDPVATTPAGQTLLALTLYIGLGVLIFVLGGLAVGLLSAPSPDDEYHRTGQPRGESQRAMAGRHRSWLDLFGGPHGPRPIAH